MKSIITPVLDNAGIIGFIVEYMPDYVEAYCNLGVLLQAQGHVEAAIAMFDRALQYKKDFTQAHWNRAVAWLLSGPRASPFCTEFSTPMIVPSQPGGAAEYTYCVHAAHANP